MAPPLDQRPNHSLIGVPGSRERLATPALVLDIDAFEGNIAAMASWAEKHSLGLRPHAKTHKCSIIAKRQVEAGALGNCTATLSEAEVLVDAGVPGVLITSTVVTPDRIERLVALNDRASRLMVIVDDPANVDALNEAMRQGAEPLYVLVDVEVGCGRTGVVSQVDAVDLIDKVTASPNLRFGGLQAYDGGVQAIESFEDRRKALDSDLQALREVIDVMNRRGTIVPMISGGGTGTHEIDRIGGVFTEIQAGSYIVMDSIYNGCDLHGSGAAVFFTSLFVRATVISTAKKGFVTTDAGLKAFSVGSGDPQIASGAPQGATYTFMGDEHGRITFAKDGHGMALGDQVECIAPHCDPTIALYDCYHVVRGDTLIDIWPIDARGHW
ncbi:MAG: threonine aldolase [Rhodospirillaceae bacterium]|nr:threonine aldolase [Rhodospirillaceae bacterium]|tara:strand:- start:5192 stop:6340 length:1149 start_codon:yes stop_codon:yes gene_type:complete